jgi:hypothetical protein
LPLAIDAIRTPYKSLLNKQPMWRASAAACPKQEKLAAREAEMQQHRASDEQQTAEEKARQVAQLKRPSLSNRPN